MSENMQYSQPVFISEQPKMFKTMHVLKITVI